MRWLVVGLLALTACASPRNAACQVSCATGDDCPGGLACEGGFCRVAGDPCLGPDGDAAIPPDQPLPPDSPVIGQVCAGAMAAPLGQICFDPAPPAVLFQNEVVNTNNDSRCIQMTYNGFAVCLIPVDFVATKVRFEGTRPIVLWSAGTLTVTQTGVVDVSSPESAPPGASANFSICSAGDGTLDGDSIGSGGSGGTMIVLGGNGGDIGNTSGGLALMDPSGTELRGGCPGGSGGAAAQPVRKNGGGVAYLVARNRIVIDGKLNASGGGGPAAGFGDGGNGGGSGGQLVFDASTIDFHSSAIVLALGGGGSSGSRGGTSTAAGKVGNEPRFVAPFYAQPSSGVSGCDIAGGYGSQGDGVTHHPDQDGNDVAPTQMSLFCSAGGGGGGDGSIRTFGDATIVEPTKFLPHAAMF